MSINPSYETVPKNILIVGSRGDEVLNNLADSIGKMGKRVSHLQVDKLGGTLGSVLKRFF